ncbi:TIGR03620 family F420-dependent LLM class oxidoreductase [Occultella gossypii]|uniref:TIGR03620 family F420-dependent LLM class oxidoreductase n=1 Tax=Occultella gossypii TaxID=2800820 RepID=A0ABS7SFW4_9MICO|nr:TIGR03620 family F420-dependent LLM class oxidoreductase [Occultella gossypii]MBZ2198654.1 TIGR03620 family F420-dependent LLM class oxidoreductase [Occultella gossypii]
MRLELGRYGVWLRARAVDADLARAVERLGYGTLWLGGVNGADLEDPESALAATDSLVVATGIVNIWSADAARTARSYQRLAERFPNRFQLGVGIGHPERTDVYASPYDTTVAYLDALAEHGVPTNRTVLAALGPRVLRLAGTRTAGAHPYLTTPAHTAGAREVLGAAPLLAPEQKVVVDTDPERARAIGRDYLAPYLALSNYTRMLRTLGFTDADFADGGSDALVDQLVLHGDAATVAAGLAAHLEAGADHVAIQPLTEPARSLAALAPLLGL